MNHPRVAIVVLNWNRPDDTLVCLESLARIDHPITRIIVVDNGSTDDSVAVIHAGFPDVQILETGANLGYAGGNNVGIRQALDDGSEFVCLLNNDVVVEPGFLTPLVGALVEQPTVGLATPLVAERMNDGSVWALGAAVEWRTAAVNRIHAGQPVAVWRGRPPFSVDVASGAAMLVKREVCEKVGLLDEAYFLYYEEVDWCLTVRQAGFQIQGVPPSVVWHKVSATLGTTSPVIDYYMLRNHLRLIARKWPRSQRAYLLMRVVLRDLGTVAAYSVKPHRGSRVPNRNARLLALRDAVLGRWGPMGPDVVRACRPNP